MNYRLGLVGKPLVGKSTFFNAATMNDVSEGAYSFTMIDPSVGEAYVHVECVAPEFGHICTLNHGYCADGVGLVPTKLVDVAGLVPGAHEGKGLGNQFLSDLNETDVLVALEFVWDFVTIGVWFVLNGFRIPDGLFTDDLSAAFLSTLPPSTAYMQAVSGVLVGSLASGSAWYLSNWFGLVVLVLWGLVPAMIGYRRYSRADL